MKFAKSMLIGTLGVVLAGLILALVAPKTAHALAATLVQVTNTSANPVPNQDVDNPAQNFYQSVNSTSGCSGTCVVTFAAVPAGKRLIIQQVSSLVTIGVSAGTPPADVELRGQGGSNVFQFIPIVPAPANYGAQTQFTAHAGVLASYDSGQIPTVDAFIPSGQTYELLASISGYMVNIP
jgi:hypothetical protein